MSHSEESRSALEFALLPRALPVNLAVCKELGSLPVTLTLLPVPVVLAAILEGDHALSITFARYPATDVDRAVSSARRVGTYKECGVTSSTY